MALRELNLIVDKDSGRLVESFTSTLQAQPQKFVLGDLVPVSVRVVTEDPASTWKEVDLTGQSVRIGVGTPAGSPSSGTFTLTYGGDTTSELAYNASASAVQTALNALSSISSAGDVSVTKSTKGAYRITFDSVGARTAFTSDVSELYPTSGAEVTEAIAGDASTREVVVIKIETQPAAYATLSTSLASAAATVATVRGGASGVSEIQTFELDPVPYAGTYTITIDGEETVAIAYDAAPATIKSAIEGLTSIGAGKVTVSGSFPAFTVEFDATLTDVAEMTVDVTGLTVPVGRKGSIDCNTTGMVELLDGAARASATLEIELYDSGAGTAFTVAQAACSVFDDLIGNSPTSSTPGPSYPTTDAVIRYDSAITGLTGGTASDLDGIATVDEAVGRVQAVVIPNATYLYKLTAGTTAESSPTTIRPDDYAASTNEKVWALLGINAGLVKSTALQASTGLRLTGGVYEPGSTYMNISATPTSFRAVTLADAAGQIAVGSSSTSAPASAPAAVGLFHTDTDDKVIYVSVGTASAADWIPFATTLGHPIGWNATQSKFQKLTISGAAGSEILSISDL